MTFESVKKNDLIEYSIDGASLVMRVAKVTPTEIIALVIDADKHRETFINRLTSFSPHHFKEFAFTNVKLYGD